jgi:hypothetical protein
VSDTGSDSAEAVCSFLYTLLVSEEPVMQAFELAVEEDKTKGLGSEISHAFADLSLLRVARPGSVQSGSCLIYRSGA